MTKISTSEVVSKNTQAQVKKYLKCLSDLLEKLDEGSLTFHYGGRPVRAQKSDLVRIISRCETNNLLELGIRNIVLEAVMTSESLSAGSGYLALKSILRNKSETFDYKNLSELSDINAVLSNLMGVGLSKKLVYTIIKDAAINSEVSLSSSKMAFSPVISVKPVLEIKGTLSEMFSTKRKRLESCAVIFIDGIVESLGNIDSLLQSFGREKKNLALFARGFSPEVVGTLSQNFNSGNLYVFPIKVEEKDETLKSVENHKNFYNIDNIHEIRSLTVDSFDFEYSVGFENRKTTIEGIESIDRKVHITFPSHYKNLTGLLEDRIRYGQRVSIETASSGIAVSKGEKKDHFSLKSVKQSIKTVESLQKSLENLGAFVLQH